MEREARGLARLDLGFDVIVTSPFTRCLHTAQICATYLGIPVVPDPRVQPGFDVSALTDILIEHSYRDAVLVCGHQPDLTEVTYDLVRGGITEFRKGSLAIISFEETPRLGAGVLTALYPPAALRQLAG